MNYIYNNDTLFEGLFFEKRNQYSEFDSKIKLDLLDQLADSSFCQKRNQMTSQMKAFLDEDKVFRAISDNVYVLQNLANTIRKLSSQSVVVVADSIPYEIFCKYYPELSCIGSVVFIDSISNGHDLMKHIGTIQSEECDMLLGVGGGRTLDFLKFMAYKTGLKMIAFPSSLSTHVFASRKIHALKPIQDLGYRLTIDGDDPHLSLLDINVLEDLSRTQSRLIYSGFGDIMAFINGRLDWLLAVKKGKATYHLLVDEFIDYIIHVLETIDLTGALSEWVSTYNLIQVLLCHITSWVGSMPASGAEHLFARAIEDEVDELPLHGELVALGVLLFMFIRGESVEPVIRLMDKFHISRSFTVLGIHREAVIKALMKALSFGQEKDRYTILDELEWSYVFFDASIEDMMANGMIFD